MKLYIKICLLILWPILTIFPDNEKIGITQLCSDYKKFDADYFIRLEEKIMALISDLPSKELYALNINSKSNSIKETLKIWKDNTSDESIINIDNDKLAIINEIKNLDYCIAFEVPFFYIKEEMDFYDVEKFYHYFKSTLKILTLDCKNKKIIGEENITVEFKSDIEKGLVLDKGIENTIKKLKSYLDYQSIFREKIYPVEIGKLFIRFNKGKLNGIKPQDVLVSYGNEEYETKEKSAVRIIKADDRESIASILYTDGRITKDQYFNKISKINLEIQLGGGFSLADKRNPVISKTPDITILPFGTIRTLIPVGIAFFRPAFQVDFNFFYLDNKFLMPFTFEAGCQGEFNIHRFGIDAGLLLGALFSPDKNRNYKIDSVVLRPYLHLSVLALTTVKIFGEVGYRYYIEGVFYKNWDVDLKGPYFLFGIGINL